MKNFQLVASGVDVLPLLIALKRNPDLWKEDTFLRDYPQGPFKQIESVMLRFPVRVKTLEEDKTRDQHESTDQPAYKQLHEARPLIMALMARMQGERLGRCMINKICPGGRIFPHADTPVHAEYWDRFHIVLQSAPGSNFRCGEESVHMAPGEVWWFQNAIEHEVVNTSDTDRIHLIVDIRLSR